MARKRKQSGNTNNAAMPVFGELSASLHSAVYRAYVFEEYALHYLRSPGISIGNMPRQAAH